MDVKDLPKYIKDVKRKYRMRKMSKEFNIKEIKENGKIIKTLTIDGLNVKIYQYRDFDAPDGGPVATTKSSLGYTNDDYIVGPPGTPVMLINDEFFSLPIDLQKFVLYHEFGHLRLHIPESDIIGPLLPKKEMEKIAIDVLRQQIPYDRIIKNGTAEEKEIVKRSIDNVINNIEKAVPIKDNTTTVEYRLKVRKYFENYIKKDLRTKAAFDFWIDRMDKTMGKEAGDINRAAKGHYSVTELEADDYARRHMKNKGSKGLKYLNKIINQSDATNVNNAIKEIKDGIKSNDDDIKMYKKRIKDLEASIRKSEDYIKKYEKDSNNERIHRSIEMEKMNINQKKRDY